MLWGYRQSPRQSHGLSMFSVDVPYIKWHGRAKKQLSTHLAVLLLKFYVNNDGFGKRLRFKDAPTKVLTLNLALRFFRETGPWPVQSADQTLGLGLQDQSEEHCHSSLYCALVTQPSIVIFSNGFYFFHLLLTNCCPYIFSLQHCYIHGYKWHLGLGSSYPGLQLTKHIAGKETVQIWHALCASLFVFHLQCICMYCLKFDSGWSIPSTAYLRILAMKSFIYFPRVGWPSG